MKTQIVKKCVAFSTAVIMLLGFTGCDKLGLGDNSSDEITDVMSDYMDKIMSGKYSAAAKFLKNSDDDNLVAIQDEMDDDYLALLDAYIASTEYEIEDAEAKKESSGSLSITITVPDIEDALESMDGSGVDALIEAMDDADTVEESFTIKFTYDDEWLIKDASGLESFYIDNVEDVTLSNLTEEAALEYINSGMDAIVSGDLEAAYEYMNDDDLTFEEYMASEDMSEAQLNVMSELFSHMTYTSEVTETGDNYVDVTVNMTIPDINEVTSIAFDDDFVARAYAYFIWGGDDADSLLEDDMANSLSSAIDSATGTTNGSMVVRVTADEEGNLDGETIEESDIFDFEIDGDSIISSDANQEDYVMPALEFALSSGLISQDEYDEFMAQLNGSDPDSDITDNAEAISITDTGDDFWRMYFYDDIDFTNEVTEYHAGDEGIFFDAGTWAYYFDDEVMTIDVYYNGELATTFTIATAYDYNDRGYGSLTMNDGSGLPAGTYVFDITGFDGDHYATVTIIVSE